MTRASWRRVRPAMVAIAGAAILLNGVRELPPLQAWKDGYSLWQGVRRARSDVARAWEKGGGVSNGYRRAVLNLRQSERQLAWFIAGYSPGPIGWACVGALALSTVATASGAPIWLMRAIRRRLDRRRESATDLGSLD